MNIFRQVAGAFLAFVATVPSAAQQPAAASEAQQEINTLAGQAYAAELLALCRARPAVEIDAVRLFAATRNDQLHQAGLGPQAQQAVNAGLDRAYAASCQGNPEVAAAATLARLAFATVTFRGPTVACDGVNDPALLAARRAAASEGLTAEQRVRAEQLAQALLPTSCVPATADRLAGELRALLRRAGSHYPTIGDLSRSQFAPAANGAPYELLSLGEGGAFVVLREGAPPLNRVFAQCEIGFDACRLILSPGRIVGEWTRAVTDDVRLTRAELQIRDESNGPVVASYAVDLHSGVAEFPREALDRLLEPGRRGTGTYAVIFFASSGRWNRIREFPIRSLQAAYRLAYGERSAQ